MLTILATILSLTNPTATVCATIDNGTNLATWTNAKGVTVQATYIDDGADHLKYSRYVPKQVREAEEALQYGKVGHKVITVCS